MKHMYILTFLLILMLHRNTIGRVARTKSQKIMNPDRCVKPRKCEATYQELTSGVVIDTVSDFGANAVPRSGGIPIFQSRTTVAEGGYKYYRYAHDSHKDDEAIKGILPASVGGEES